MSLLLLTNNIQILQRKITNEKIQTKRKILKKFNIFE